MAVRATYSCAAWSVLGTLGGGGSIHQYPVRGLSPAIPGACPASARSLSESHMPGPVPPHYTVYAT
eukprot:1399403-Prymnesium_polylepis.1